jgi:hypothetical protein
MKINDQACASYALISLVTSYVDVVGKIILISFSTMPTSSYSYETNGDHGENLKWHTRINVFQISPRQSNILK